MAKLSERDISSLCSASSRDDEGGLALLSAGLSVRNPVVGFSLGL